jgi:hypothetical protein
MIVIGPHEKTAPLCYNTYNEFGFFHSCNISQIPVKNKWYKANFAQEEGKAK